MAPTIDSASLEHPDPATETAPAPFARWLHKSELPTSHHPLYTDATSFISLGNPDLVGINEGNLPHRIAKTVAFRDLTTSA